MYDRFFDALMFGVLKANLQYNHSLKQLKSTKINWSQCEKGIL